MDKKKYTTEILESLPENPDKEALEEALAKVWRTAFVAGYERGKSDERDAIEIDRELGKQNEGES